MRFEISYETACCADGDFERYGSEKIVLEADSLSDVIQIAKALRGEERGLEEFLHRIVFICKTEKSPSHFDNDIATWGRVLDQLREASEHYEFWFGDAGRIVGLRKKPEQARQTI